MAMLPDDADTIETQALSTSLDPYGQLVKMLMPRALCIAIYDAQGLPLWLSDSCDDPSRLQLVEESLTAAREDRSDPEERDGFARSWDDGDTAYVFILRDGSTVLGALAVSCQNGGGPRPFSLIQGLLRPVLQVLTRELANQSDVGELHGEQTLSDGDLELVLGDVGSSDEGGSDAIEDLVRTCVSHLDCALGAVLIPDKKIAISYSASASTHRTDMEVLEKTQRHLYAWAQVQRRTLMLNKAPPSSPLGSLPYKILACPIRYGAQHVAGILVLFKSMTAIGDFDGRQVRIVEMMTRRIAHVLQSAYDPATDLLTRPAFEQRALAVLNAADAKGEHCVVYADVDRLHVVNENHGMHVGDQVIGCIAATMRASLPSTVSASRISGDRFALFLPETTIESAQVLLENLCGEIGAADFSHEGKKIAVSMSFGIADVPNTKFALSHALAAAEVACKAAKDRGRGRVEVYQDADRSIVRRFEDVTIVGTLREAIANDRFRMEAQPVVAMDRERPGHYVDVRRFELLLRMIDPSGASIAPDKFLSAAERYQLATEIDRWVVQYVLEVLSSAAPALVDLGAHFAINISGQSLGDEDFMRFVEAKLREYQLPPSLLSFEITETAAVANIVRAETLIRRLQAMGHAIALDDFGRGLSSLTYLKSLPVSDLKIDGALVRDLVGPDTVANGRAQAMVTAIVQLAQAMKLKTTAECVESEAILAAVGQLGVDHGQGFAIGRPRPLEIVLQELLKGAPGAASPANVTRMARLAG
jgi:diguanylate cyclase (GGDEF)-like protein